MRAIKTNTTTGNYIQAGYTLLETVMVLAIVGLLTATLVGGYNDNTRVQRFSGRITEIANTLQEAQVSSFTVSNEADCPYASESSCYWRGRLLEFDVTTNSMKEYVLFGLDTTRLNSDRKSNEGLATKSRVEETAFSSQGISLDSITYNGSNTNQASIAYVAPSSEPFTDNGIFAPNGNPQAPYSGKATIIMQFSDEATDLTGTIEFDANNDTISTSVK